MAEFTEYEISTDYAHIEPKLEIIKSSRKFKNWLLKNNNDVIRIKKIKITDVDFFGKIEPDRLGFVKLKAEAFNAHTNAPISSIAFIRGDSVSILIIVSIEETDKKYVLMCEQIRFPVGRRMVEACAGMVDESTGNIIGVVFKEVAEETGFIINKDDPLLLSHGIIYPSPGACDEAIHLYSWNTIISEKEFEEKNQKIFGEGEHESIKLRFYDYETFDGVLDEIGDVKAESIWRRLCNSRK